MKDLNTALAAKKISQEQYNTTAEQLEQQHQVNLAKIRSEAVVSPQQQAAGMVDPVQQLANENAQKLALIQQFETAGILQHGQAIALKNAQDTTYEQARFDAIWNLWKSQDQVNGLMGSAIDSLSSGTASALSGIISGTQSAGDAMRNLAAGALNAVLQQLIQMAVQALLVRTILGSFMGGLGAIPSFGSISSSVGSVGASAGTDGMGMGTNWQSYISGARKNGGPVEANGLYRFGEGGKPELYQSSTGKNYLLPGEGGKVISNKDMQGGGGMPNVVFNVYDQSGGSKAYDYQASMAGDTLTVTAFIADMDNGGPLSQSFTRNHQAPRKATQ